MADLSPVETLRAAAAKLRETAEGTSIPPWYEDGQEGVYAYGAPGEPCPNVFRDRRVRYQDVLWIELVNPEIAVPLADWLDEAASHLAENVAVWTQPTTTIAQVDVASATEFHYGKALRVARVLLGVPDGPR